MKDTIVTAIYYTPYTSRIGGRGYTFEYYANPFRNLLSLNMNIVVYTHLSEYDKIIKFFRENNFGDYKVINYDLNNYAFSDKIYQIKEDRHIINANGLIPGNAHILNDRNTHLCLSKMDFLKMTIDGSYFGSVNYYWMDAGLFHNGLFPTSLGGMERFLKPDLKKFWPKNSKNLCKPDLIAKLKGERKLLFLGLTNPQAIPPWWNKLHSSELKSMHIVGGVFGGAKDEVLKLCAMFGDLVMEVMGLNELTLEEDILTMLVLNNKLDYLTFDTWYHDVPTDSCYVNVGNQKSFYKLFI